MCFDVCKIGCNVVLVRLEKMGHDGNSPLFFTTRPWADESSVCEGFGDNFVVGACEPFTCAVPDDAMRNGTEIWVPARERVLQFLVWCR